MVNSVSTPKITRTSIFYINDVHGQVPNMERIYTASKAFDSFESTKNTDKLKFSSGDVFLGEGLKLNESALTFLNAVGISATAVGNHELDMDLKDLAEVTKNSKFKMLGLNANIDKQNPLSSKIIKSYIEEKNGTKYGIIGLMPFDLFDRIKSSERLQGLKINKLDETLEELQIEVDNLQKQGINKIILLSHVGYKNDLKIAKEITGIDVILGGHSHDLIKDIKAGKNLFYSKKGEPIIITQAGKEGNNFGVLDLEFDEKGIITEAQNNVNTTRNFKKNQPIKYILDNIMGKPEKIGVIASAEAPPENILIAENPSADFIADAMRIELDTDVAMINGANPRGTFEVGPVDTLDVSSIIPFKDKMTIIKINEKELVDALKLSAKSMIAPDSRPGLLQVSGIRYKVNKKGEVLEAKIIDKTGKENTLDINNPNTFKTYRVAVDDFYAKGSEGFTMLNKFDVAEKVLDFDKDKLACDLIKKLNKPIDIKTDGRIQVVD